MSPVRCGVSTYAFARKIAAGRMGIDELLDWAAEHDVDTIQFCENLPWSFDRPIPAGINIETGCRGIGEHLLIHLELATKTQSPFVRLVIDDRDDHPSLEEAIERLNPYVQQFRNKGVILAIENHDRFPAANLRAAVDELGTDAVGIVLDTANSLGCLEGTETVLTHLGPVTVNLHVKEVTAVRKPDMLGFDIIGAPLGEGQIDWPAILSQVPNVRSATLEQWVPPGPEALDIELKWATQGVQFLKSLVAKFSQTQRQRHITVVPDPLRGERAG
jgi:sugar phosphate isomerase/epimerase